MSKINIRGLIGKDIIADLSPDKLAELQKLQLDIEKINANKQLEGDNLYNIRLAKIWGSIIILFFICLFMWLSIPKIIYQYIAIKNGYCMIDGNMIKKENTPLALQYQHAIRLAKDGKMSVDIPYLVTSSSDYKIQADINNQTISYLKSFPKTESIKQNSPMIENRTK